MKDTLDDNKGFSHKHYLSYEETINLNLNEALQKEQLITSFTADKRTKCVEVRLNHAYNNKTLVSPVYGNWLTTIDTFTTRAKQKGISDKHIVMLTDTLDDNNKRIIEFVIGEASNKVNTLQLVRKEIVDLFLDEVKIPYAAIKVEDHIETAALEGKRFEDWAGRLYYNYRMLYDGYSDILSKEEINRIRSVLRFDATSVSTDKDSKKRQNVRTLHLRVASSVDTETSDLDNNVIYYDLCNLDWEIIKITRHGWEMLKHNEQTILFKRFPIMNEQTYPRRDYPSDILEQFMRLTNVYDDEDNNLLAKVYLISLFLLADLPKPMLNPNGPHGSGKSTYQEFVKLIVDPAAALTTAFPNSLSELVQALSHSYLTFFDNVSEITELTSDQLCRAVTGSGFVKRVLYENDEDFIYNMKRAVGYNGINVTAHRADLLARLLNLRLKHIDKRKRKKLRQLQNEFDKIRPYLLGYIFDVLVEVLKRIGEVRLEEFPRMADFAEMGELIARCLGYREGRFVETYDRNIGHTNEEIIDSNLVAMAVKILMNKQKSCAGKAGELLTKFNELAAKNTEIRKIVENRWWPKTPRGISNKITEVEPNLKEVGIIIERRQDKHSKSDVILITNKNYEPPQTYEGNEDDDHDLELEGADQSQ